MDKGGTLAALAIWSPLSVLKRPTTSTWLYLFLCWLVMWGMCRLFLSAAAEAGEVLFVFGPLRNMPRKGEMIHEKWQLVSTLSTIHLDVLVAKTDQCESTVRKVEEFTLEVWSFCPGTWSRASGDVSSRDLKNDGHLRVCVFGALGSINLELGSGCAWTRIPAKCDFYSHFFILFHFQTGIKNSQERTLEKLREASEAWEPQNATTNLFAA